ncbi:MAG: Lipopolysaccharide O-side chain biosynthesis protein (O-antigen transporter) [Parcubacteria group bacterium LiPW_15]|nr:MAG: Lipopolysaccharide O-side chain biosynthesis protein (O-antigen transporter) [Parcubacteria group bacterium LiPW_15]
MFRKIKSFLFENQHAKQTVAKNTFWLSIGTVASRVIKALIIIYAARILGAENYGVFSYALSLSAMFSIFADIGMSAVLTREASRDPENLEKNLGTSFVVKLSLVAFSFALVALVAPIFSTVKGAGLLMPLAALLVAFDALRDFSFSITRAKERMEVEAAIGMTTGIAITVFGFIAIHVSPTPYSLLVGYVSGSALGFFLAFFLLREYVQRFWKSFDWSIAKNMLRDAAPLAIMGLLGALTINTDTIMLGWLKSATDVGLYAAAQRPVLLIYLISTLLATSIFPIISKLAHKNDERCRSILEKTVSISLLAALPIFVGGAVLSKQIVLFLFGSGYASIAPTFTMLLFTVVLIFPASIILNSVFAYGGQKIMLISAAIGGIGNVIFDFLLIPPFGIFGSAVATVISQSLAYGLAWKRMKDLNNFYTLRYIKKGLLASAVMGVSTYGLSLLGIQVVVNIVISAFIYFGTLTLLKEKLIKESLDIFRTEEPKAL